MSSASNRGSMRWTESPQYAPDEDGLEAIRQIAWDLIMYMDFHEVALSDPFEAENQMQRVGRMLTGLVGFPKGWRHGVFVGPDE